MESLRPAEIEIRGGEIRSREYGDIYFSTAGGLEETRHVFHESIALGQLWKDRSHFTIAETGFGTGLNFLATWQKFDDEKDSPDLLHYISIERHPIDIEDLVRCHNLFPGLSEKSATLRDHHPILVSGFHRLWLVPGRVCLTLCFMDIAAALNQLEADIDCWFLDGFSPAQNPGMWQSQVISGIGRLSVPGTRVATFTSAGAVRRGLETQGFVMRKIPGFGRKREMLTGYLENTPLVRDLARWYQRPNKLYPDKHAAVIGSGIAGAQAAWHLAIRGWNVTVHERRSSLGGEASGNPAAIVSPRLTADASVAESFSSTAWLYQLQQIQQLGATQCGFHPCGTLQLARNVQKMDQWRQIRARQLPAKLVECVDQHTASKLACVPVDHPALFFKQAGWLEPDKIIFRLLDHPNITIHRNSEIAIVRKENETWQLLDSIESHIASSMVVVFASGCGTDFDQLQSLSFTPVKGQTSWISTTNQSEQLRPILQHDGYLLPAVAGRHLIGATYERNVANASPDSDADQTNLDQLLKIIPELSPGFDKALTAHAAIRMTSNNRQPYVGAVPDKTKLDKEFGAMHRRNFSENGALATSHAGLFISGAHGSRGFTNAALSAELLACLINREPLPVSKASYHALHPARELVRKLQRRQHSSV